MPQNNLIGVHRAVVPPAPVGSSSTVVMGSKPLPFQQCQAMAQAGSSARAPFTSTPTPAASPTTTATTSTATDVAGGWQAAFPHQG